MTNSSTGCGESSARATTFGIRSCLPDFDTLFLYYGRDDTMVSLAHARLYAKAIPTAHVR